MTSKLSRSSVQVSSGPKRVAALHLCPSSPKKPVYLERRKRLCSEVDSASSGLDVKRVSNLDVTAVIGGLAGKGLWSFARSLPN